MTKHELPDGWEVFVPEPGERVWHFDTLSGRLSGEYSTRLHVGYKSKGGPIWEKIGKTNGYSECCITVRPVEKTVVSDSEKVSIPDGWEAFKPEPGERVWHFDNTTGEIHGKTVRFGPYSKRYERFFSSFQS